VRSLALPAFRMLPTVGPVILALCVPTEALSLVELGQGVKRGAGWSRYVELPIAPERAGQVMGRWVSPSPVPLTATAVCSRGAHPTPPNRWGFSDLKALFLNCTLKRSPELSHTDGLIRISQAITGKNCVGELAGPAKLSRATSKVRSCGGLQAAEPRGSLFRWANTENASQPTGRSTSM